MDQGIAVIIAAAVAILGIFYTARQQRKMLRKQHTFQVIDRLNDWEAMDWHVDFAAGLIRRGAIPQICNEGQKADCDKLDWLLNYYEFLASAIICGDIDEELVKRTEESRLCRSYLKLLPYVREAREDRDDDKTWENLEFLVYRWVKPRADQYDQLLDRFFLRPTINNYHHMREEIAAFLDVKSANIR